MRRLFLLSSVLLAFGVSIAHAQDGINLRWSNCYGDAGTSNRTFACNTNAGSHVLVGSFVLPWAMPSVSGQEIIIDATSASTNLPPWWSFKNAGTCRQASLSMNFVLPVTAANCIDWADGQSAGGIAAYNIGFTGSNKARLIAAVAVPQSALANLVTGQEYFSFNVVINSQKTVGTGACVGCDVPVTLVFGSFKVTTPVAANDVIMTWPTAANSNVATWQALPVPTRRDSWGAVKALYR